MPDTVIDWVNLPGKYQQELLVYADLMGQSIGDCDVKITGVDGDGDENEAPLKIENENDLDYQEDKEEFHPVQEYQTIIKQPVKVELGPLEARPTIIVQVPENMEPHTV